MRFLLFCGKQGGLRERQEEHASRNGFVSGWYSMPGSWRDGKYSCAKEVVRETRTMPG